MDAGGRPQYHLQQCSIHSPSGILPQSAVVSICVIRPDTIGPRMMAEPWPAKPNDTALTPSYSVGLMAFV